MSSKLYGDGHDPVRLTPNQANALFYFTTSMRVAAPDVRTIRAIIKKGLLRFTKQIGRVRYYVPTRKGDSVTDAEFDRRL